MISRPHRLTTEGTMPPKWLESTGGRWGRTRCRTCHGTSFPLSSLPIVSGTYDRRLAQFAILVFFDKPYENYYFNSILKFFQVDITGIFRMTSSARYFKAGVGSSRPS